jgi:hypothetical protein
MIAAAFCVLEQSRPSCTTATGTGLIDAMTGRTILANSGPVSI